MFILLLSSTKIDSGVELAPSTCPQNFVSQLQSSTFDESYNAPCSAISLR